MSETCERVASRYNRRIELFHPELALKTRLLVALLVAVSVVTVAGDEGMWRIAQLPLNTGRVVDFTAPAADQPMGVLERYAVKAP
jgi:hypothetical protein